SDATKQMRVGLPGLRPSRGSLRKSLWWAGGGVRKIAFVVPKVDMVHPDDRDRLEKLGKDLIGGLIADLKDGRTPFLPCSAIYSSIDPDEIRRPDPGRECRPNRDGRGPDAAREAGPAAVDDGNGDGDEDEETTHIYYKVRKEVEAKPGQYQRRKRYKEV